MLGQVLGMECSAAIRGELDGVNAGVGGFAVESTIGEGRGEMSM